MKPNRSIFYVGLGLLAVLVVASIVVATRPTETIDPNTPAGVVQRYVQYVMEGDHDLAAELLADDTMCDAGDLDRAYIDQGARIDLLESVVDGERARVRIQISAPTGDLVENTWTDERTIRLVKADGQWRITGIPWPLYECGVWLE